MLNLISKFSSAKISDKKCLQLGIGLIPYEYVSLIDAKHMEEFAPYAFTVNEGIKIHNWRKPAITLSFGQKHKYASRQISEDAEKIEELERLLNSVTKKSEKLGSTLSNRQRARLEKILSAPEKYDLLLSSYYKFYTYPTVAYKYIDYSDPDFPLGKYVSKNGNIAITKKNIIFVDFKHLNNKKHVYSSKVIEKKLLSYEKVYAEESMDLFARLKKVEKP